MENTYYGRMEPMPKKKRVTKGIHNLMLEEFIMTKIEKLDEKLSTNFQKSLDIAKRLIASDMKKVKSSIDVIAKNLKQLYDEKKEDKINNESGAA